MGRMTSKPILKDADRELYPVHLLKGCETGLCLFAAAFLGLNDAAHFEEAGVRTTCVDTDEDRLGQMSFYYPKDWHFRAGDAWSFADDARFLGAQWDAVSVDPFTGDPMDRAIESSPLWLSLARKVVTIGVPANSRFMSYHAPGWKSYLHPRSATASWLVLERV